MVFNKKILNSASVLLTLIIAFAALIRIPLIQKGFFAFTYDQGRDLFAVKEIVEKFNFTLIGPTTGLPGIFYGPWWYYYLSPIYFVSNGNPLQVALSFALLGVFVVFLTYLLSLKITNNKVVSLAAALIVATSQPFLTASSQIWSPSLIPPLMILYVLSLYKIIEVNKTRKWFLILGLTSGFIVDSEAAFGLMLVLSTLLAGVFFKKEFYTKSLALFFLGLFIIFSPRVLFEFRNDFLITKSIVVWLKNPSVYQEKLSLLERFINRIDIFYLSFSQTFSKGSKILALIPLSFIVLVSLTQRKKIKNGKLFAFMLTVVAFLYLNFSLYPDALWEYYVSGISVIFIFILLMSLATYYKKAKLLTLFLIFVIISLNFEKRFIFPFRSDWEGDGAVYKNQIAPLEDVKGQLIGDYSIYAYSPAGIDYPFEYLIQMYYEKGLIEKPKEDQDTFFLIIRDDYDHLYLKIGWYGDKVRDSTEVLERREYPGNIIVEKHERINQE